jgi:DNA-binding response OmpR family regulator
MIEKTVLIVEDEPDLAMGLADNLAIENFNVLTAEDGEAGVNIALDKSPDLILLDVMLPKLDGFEACRRIRRGGGRMPILMLTARTGEAEKIRGLELGADDYVTKPFSIRELIARIKASIRRSEAYSPADVQTLSIGSAVVDLVKGKISRGDEDSVLGHYEGLILKMLADSAGEPVDRNDILQEIWGFTDPTNRTVDNHVVSLRRKIEPDPRSPTHILTVHGIGYKLVF